MANELVDEATQDAAEAPAEVLDSIDTQTNLPDYTPPPGVVDDDPGLLEWVDAAFALQALELQAGDPAQVTPSQNDLRSAHDRYKAADAWYQAALADHRRAVQAAHGVDVGPDQTLG